MNNRRTDVAISIIFSLKITTIRYTSRNNKINQKSIEKSPQFNDKFKGPYLDCAKYVDSFAFQNVYNDVLALMVQSKVTNVQCITQKKLTFATFRKENVIRMHTPLADII